MKPYDRLVDALGGLKSGMGRCPAHDDGTASLSVTEGADGSLLVKCHAGCDTKDVLSQLGLTMRDLFPGAVTPAKRRIVDHYPYVDEQGQLLYEVVRYEPKEFRQRRPDGRGGWVWKLGDTRRVLYRLPQVIEAAAQGTTVFVVEGEKDVAALEQAGYVATCNPQGAGSWPKVPDAWQVLWDADVVVVADKDDRGREHACEVAASLQSTAASILVVQASVGKDVADHLGAGHAVNELEILAGTGPNDPPLGDWINAVPPPPLSDHAEYIKARILTTEQIRQLEPPQPLIDGYLYLDSLALLYGSSGIGKSHVAVDMAMTVTARDHWFGKDVAQGQVLYVVAEGVAGIGIRTEAWEAWKGAPGTVLWYPQAVNMYAREWAEALAEVVAQLKPQLVVVDTLARSIVGADENSARDIGLVVDNLDHVRKCSGSCVLVVHHAGKDTAAGARGNSALKGALDTELELTNGGGDGSMTLKTTKQKNAVEQPPLYLALQTVPDTASVVVVEEHRNRDDQLTAGTLATLETLKVIDVPQGVTSREWEMAADVPQRTYYRHRGELLQRSMVANVGSKDRPRYRPQPQLTDRNNT